MRSALAKDKRFASYIAMGCIASCAALGFLADSGAARAVYFTGALVIVALIFCEVRLETHLWGVMEDTGLDQSRKREGAE